MWWPSAPAAGRPAGCLACYVTDGRAFGADEAAATARILQAIARAADAGVDAVQLREKDLPARALLQLAESAVARNPNTKILVNDRLDVALAAGAAGVHLGSESVPVADVAAFRAAGRAPAGGFLIGRSCHCLEEVLAAERDAADYVFFGPVFSTPSKARYGPPQGIEALAAVCRGARIPVLAIGGITLENAGECAAAGAAGVAAIRLFQEAEDLHSIVRRLKQAS
ncbi:MAG TPA: thiamine phosphate synthase [Candidatus Acidoferrales bacterium]|nr:thiamine phosphate synthase [Candidatus Acidoferrales bacterium]